MQGIPTKTMLIDQHLLPLKKRPYCLAFSEPEPEPEYPQKPSLIYPPKKRICHEISTQEKKEFSEESVNAMFGRMRSNIDPHITDMMLVIQKPLTASDVDNQQSRLAIPKSMVKEEFLEDLEMELLDWEGVGVKVFSSSSLGVYDMRLTRWYYAETKKRKGEKRGWKYVLNNGWNDLRKNNGLKKKQLIQLWSFRDSKGLLCFALLEGPVQQHQQQQKSFSSAFQCKQQRKTGGKKCGQRQCGINLSWGKTCPRTRRTEVQKI